VVLVANHPNGLVDGLQIWRASQRQPSFYAKSTFFANLPGRIVLNAFGALPVFRQKDDGKPGGPRGDAAERNAATFARASAWLSTGGALVIFPEGANSGPRLRPLHSGAARLAIETLKQHAVAVQIVPVALWYADQLTPRQPVLVQFAPAVPYNDLLTLEPRLAAEQLTARIAEALLALLPQADSEAELHMAQAVIALHEPCLGMPEQMAHTRQLLVEITDLRTSNPTEAARVGRRLQRMVDLAEEYLAPKPAWGQVALWLLPALGGIVAAALPVLLTRLLVRRLTGRSGATAAAWLIVLSSMLLIWWLLVALAIGLWFGSLAGGISLIGLPLLSYALLRLWEAAGGGN
jgi:1-acyl-sn-glycerol-3-phosphate acyltransferase